MDHGLPDLGVVEGRLSGVHQDHVDGNAGTRQHLQLVMALVLLQEADIFNLADMDFPAFERHERGGFISHRNKGDFFQLWGAFEIIFVGHKHDLFPGDGFRENKGPRADRLGAVVLAELGYRLFADDEASGGPGDRKPVEEGGIRVLEVDLDFMFAGHFHPDDVGKVFGVRGFGLRVLDPVDRKFHVLRREFPESLVPLDLLAEFEMYVLPSRLT